MRRISLSVVAVAAFLVAGGCKSKPAANVAATVNGKAITFEELDKAYQAQLGGNTENSSEDQVLIQKLELSRTLIDNEIMLQRAEKLGLMANDNDVQQKLNEMKAPYTKEEFEKQLTNQKMTLDDLKRNIRQNLSLQKLLNKEITSKISITDADVANFYQTNKQNFNFVEPQIRMAQIIVTPAPGDVRNLKNSKAQNEDDAKRKIQDIAQQIRNGGDFAQLAQNYSEDPNSAPNGGDLGYIGESALEKVSPELRKMVVALAPGQISPIIHTNEGYRILKVISKEPAGQRQLTDPRVQQAIRDMLVTRKDQLLKQAYYEVARNEASVINYMAKNITESANKK